MAGRTSETSIRSKGRRGPSRPSVKSGFCVMESRIMQSLARHVESESARERRPFSPRTAGSPRVAETTIHRFMRANCLRGPLASHLHWRCLLSPNPTPTLARARWPQLRFATPWSHRCRIRGERRFEPTLRRDRRRLNADAPSKSDTDTDTRATPMAPTRVRESWSLRCRISTDRFRRLVSLSADAASGRSTGPSALRDQTRDRVAQHE